MTPLALIVQAQGRTGRGLRPRARSGTQHRAIRFPARARACVLHPQDGSGIRRADQILVTSTAVEETVPDVQAARRIGATVIDPREAARRAVQPRDRRASASPAPAASPTTVGMIGWILHRAGQEPDHHERRRHEELHRRRRAVRQRPGRRRRGLRQRGRRERRLDRAVRAAHRGRQQHLARPQVDGRAAHPVPRLRRQGARRWCSISTTPRPRRSRAS